MLLLYMLWWAVLIARNVRFLRQRHYNEYKMSNYTVRLQIRRLLRGVGFFVAAIALLYYLKLRSCASFFLIWLGLGPVHLVQTSIVLTGVFVYMPKPPDLAGPVLQVWLQQFAWTLGEYGQKMRQRLQCLPQHAEQLACEPMFCFEKAIKCFYWCCLVYDYDEARGATRFSVEVAMNVFHVGNFEMLWEAREDTKVIMGWSNTCIILAFRGTASMANVLADIQAWRTPYPPARGGCCAGLLGRRPMVHRGFLRSWLANGFKGKVLNRIQQLVDSGEVDRKRLQIKVTGHSLGGALATLAAFDIRRALSWLGCLDVSCYTFGAPRTGNHAFAREYNRAVPDTWHIINDQDVVARGGKFLFRYKRPGQRVLLNAHGDLLVRPSFAKASINLTPSGARVKDHLLVAYRHSLMAVMSAQFGRKGVPQGVEGVRRLLESAQVRDLLMAAPSSVVADADIALLERLAGLGGGAAAALGGKLAQKVEGGGSRRQADSRLVWLRPAWLAHGHRNRGQRVDSAGTGSRRQEQQPPAAEEEDASAGGGGNATDVEVEYGKERPSAEGLEPEVAAARQQGEGGAGAEAEQRNLGRSAVGREPQLAACQQGGALSSLDSDRRAAQAGSRNMDSVSEPEPAPADASTTPLSPANRYMSFHQMVCRMAGLPLPIRHASMSEASGTPRDVRSARAGALGFLRLLHRPKPHQGPGPGPGHGQQQAHGLESQQRAAPAQARAGGAQGQPLDLEAGQRPAAAAGDAGAGPGWRTTGLLGTDFCLDDSDSIISSLASPTAQGQQEGLGALAGAGTMWSSSADGQADVAATGQPGSQA